MRMKPDAKIRVLVVPGWYPRWDGDGAGVFFAEQVRALRARFDVEVVTPNISTPRDWLKAATRYKTETMSYRAALRDPRVPFNVQWNRELSKRLRRAGGGAEKPDVIHLQASASWIDPRLLHPYRREGVRIVSTEHRSQLFSQTGSSEAERLREVYALCDSVTAVSEGLSRRVGELTGQQVTNFPNLVMPSSEEIGHTSTDTLQLITVCGLSPVKQVPLMLAAVRELCRTRDVRLTIVGDGPERRALQRKVDMLSLGSRVRFTGHQPKRIVDQLLSTSSAYLNASSVETFGIAIAEALAAGVPVVCTKTSGSLEIVGSGDGLIVPDPSPEALASAILMVTNCDSHAQRLARSSRIMNRFGVDAYLARATQLYTDGGPHAT